MDCIVRRAACVGMFLATAFVSPVHADPDYAETVKKSLAELESWLGDDENGRRWRDYLMSPALKLELAKDEHEVDEAIVLQVLGRYQDSASLSTRDHFRSTYRALENWANDIGVSSIAPLAERLVKDQDAFTPAEKAVAKAHERLQEAIEGVESFLKSASADRADAWKKYLRWDALMSAVAQPSISVEQLDPIRARLMRGDEGLELAAFSNLRNALDHYKLADLAQTNASAEELINNQMQSLATALQGDLSKPETRADVSRGVRLLSRLSQRPDVVQAIRSYFGRENLRVLVSSDYIAEGMAEEITEDLPVRENILGTRFRGVAATSGAVAAELVPDDQRAVVDLVFNGNAAARLRGRNGPVTVFSTSDTTIATRKRLLIDEQGLHSYPSQARCSTRTTIQSIRANRKLGSRFVEKIAWNRARQQKSQAQQIAERRAERRSARRMDERATPLIADANASFEREFRKRLSRRNIYPRRLRIRSNRRRLVATALQASDEQLAAPNLPPAVDGEFDMAMQLHETAIINSAESAIAGLTLTDERVVELLEEAEREVPEELKIAPDKDAWSITFDWTRPVTVHFQDRLMTVSIRGQRFVRGERILNRTMEISATYEMSTTSDGVRLERQGEVQVTYPGRDEGQQSIREVGFRTFVKTKFGNLFKEEFVGEGIELTGRFASAGKLVLRQIGSQAGWLTLVWD